MSVLASSPLLSLGSRLLGAQGAVAPQPFYWGSNGQMVDPSQREMQNQVDMSPIGHWTQGAARMGQAYANALQRRQQQFPSVPGGGRLTMGSLFGLNSGGLY